VLVFEPGTDIYQPGTDIYQPGTDIYRARQLIQERLTQAHALPVLSLGSLVGFLTVFGIAARNGILMISHFQHLERYEGEKFGLELVLRGANERLAPIMMTASATGLALVPLAVSRRDSGP